MAPRHTVACIGDSFTFSYGGGGLIATQFYPNRLQVELQARSVDIKARNYGISGNTTAQMVARLSCLTQYETPDIGVIYGAGNDGANASTVSGSGATTTSIPVQAGQGSRFQVGAYVLINGQSRKVSAIATDTLTLATALSGAPTNGTAVTHDTTTNLMLLGQALQAAGCNRLLVVGMHYMNWSTGGDNGATVDPTYGAYRPLQQAAATALGAVYVDTRAYMANLIATGVYAQGDFGWHIADQNGHLNAAGEQILADAIMAAIPAAWLSALS